MATGRLAVRGLDLDRAEDAAACRSALGEVAYAVVGADSRAQVDFNTFTAAVTAVEKLGAPETSHS